MDLEEFKNKLRDIIVIQDLPIRDNIEENIMGEVKDLFCNEYSFELKDGCNVKMAKLNYKCAQENMDNDTEVYIIRSKYNVIYKCFNCGSLLMSRNDLVQNYDPNNIIKKELLFPMKWKEQDMIGVIENFIKELIEGSEN